MKIFVRSLLVVLALGFATYFYIINNTRCAFRQY